LKGIAADDEIELAEMETLKVWMKENEKVIKRPPFIDLVIMLENTFTGGVIDPVEHKALLAFCKMFQYEGEYYDNIASNLQILQGMLGGIIADEIVKKEELENLREWMTSHDHLNNHWPFDEIYELVVKVLADGVVDKTEHDMLLNHFSEFSSFRIES